MRPPLDDVPGVHDQDLVGPLGGGQPVRDRQRGAAVREGVQRPGQPLLGRRVDGAGRLVEHEQVGIGHVGAGDRDQLPLPRRQRLPALADRRPRRRPRAPRPRLPRPSSSKATAIWSSVMPGPPVPDVVGHGRVEQEPVLRHHDHPGAERPERHLVQGHPAGGVGAQEHPPLDRVHEPGDQLGERRLPRAGLPHDRHPQPRRDGEVDAVERLPGARRVPEGDPVEADAQRTGRAAGARAPGRRSPGHGCRARCRSRRARGGTRRRRSAPR